MPKIRFTGRSQTGVYAGRFYIDQWVLSGDLRHGESLNTAMWWAADPEWGDEVTQWEIFPFKTNDLLNNI